MGDRKQCSLIGCTAVLAGVLAMAGTACATTQAAPAATGAEAQAASDGATRFATSADGTRIAYEVRGSGPALMLVHGAGQTRGDWDTLGYVTPLAERFTVLMVDSRGFGDSARPVEAAAYAVDRQIEDLLAVADAAGVDRFSLWGYGRGAIIGRYLAARSERVQAMIYAGVPFGPALSETLALAARGLAAKWQPIFDAQKAGTLGEMRLTDSDRETLQRGTLEVVVALQTAMLEYPPIEPGDLKAPTLWLVGTADEESLASAKAYEGKLEGTPVTLVQVSGANYSEIFTRVNAMLEHGAGFLTKQTTR
jgi:pimeloyl-ACP methyl ester carboxylesterase